MKKSREIRWAGVEFQPNLMNAKKPIKLGTVLLETSATHTGVAAIGRMPNLRCPPQEFEGVSDLMMKVAASWVDSMFKDILDADDENIFVYLTERWRWNLYLIQPKVMRSGELKGNFDAISRKVYQKFVGEPFDEKAIIAPPKPKVRVARPRTSVQPSAWRLKEFEGQMLGQLSA